MNNHKIDSFPNSKENNRIPLQMKRNKSIDAKLQETRRKLLLSKLSKLGYLVIHLPLYWTSSPKTTAFWRSCVSYYKKRFVIQSLPCLLKTTQSKMYHLLQMKKTCQPVLWKKDKRNNSRVGERRTRKSDLFKEKNPIFTVEAKEGKNCPSFAELKQINILK